VVAQVRAVAEVQVEVQAGLEDRVVSEVRAQTNAEATKTQTEDPQTLEGG